eukprot:TRINITY_DN62500_c0_g1_i1.p1 TRINITY_DN62500_c0_g1~~TRINITY_DN62500_c0_g1_i1.p1  ORF type:complete len:940 (-),score=159.26 TRINITY_DN62500_c0_g1_i1:54-2711(-)
MGACESCADKRPKEDPSTPSQEPVRVPARKALSRTSEATEPPVRRRQFGSGEWSPSLTSPHGSRKFSKPTSSNGGDPPTSRSSLGASTRRSDATSTDRSPYSSRGRGMLGVLYTYHIDEGVLGQGHGGCVLPAQHLQTRRNVAIKMTSRMETPAEVITREASILSTLNHANVVRFLGAYQEVFFVCIVMERYLGGDMLSALIANKGRITSDNVSHVAAQIASGMHYLHGKLIHHTDVTLDNYLLDRGCLLDLDCRVALCDFGSATRLPDIAKRFKEETPRHGGHRDPGTRRYWSPERRLLHWGIKDDIWAMGVVCYALLHGRLPFEEDEVEEPEYGCSSAAAEAIKGMLQTDEKNRFSAAELMNTGWVVLGTSRSCVDAAPPSDREELGEREVKEARQALAAVEVSADVADNRAELLTRMRRAHEHQSLHESRSVERFGAVDTPGSRSRRRTSQSVVVDGAKFEWWSLSRFESENVMGQVEAPKEAPAMQSSEVEALLKRHSAVILNKDSVTDKVVKTLTDEVVSGSSRLMLDATVHNHLMRVIDVVVLIILMPYGELSDRYLVEMGSQEEKGEDSSRGHGPATFPSTKKLSSESTRFCVERFLRRSLSIPNEVPVSSIAKVDYTSTHVVEERSAGGKGKWPTIYLREYLSVSLIPPDEIPRVEFKEAGLDETFFQSPCFKTGTFQVDQNRHFTWLTREECTKLSLNVLMHKNLTSAPSCLVSPKRELNNVEVHKFLWDAGVDMNQLGKGQAASVQALSKELRRGEAELKQGGENGVLRSVDIVLLLVRNPLTGETLVQTQKTVEGRQVSVVRLPGVKRRPGENMFAAARRVLTDVLKMGSDEIQIDKERGVQEMHQEQDSASYPGLKTRYSRHIVHATPWLASS